MLPNWQHSRSTACALLSDHGYLLIQAFFQALQSHSWGLTLIQSLSELPEAVLSQDLVSGVPSHAFLFDRNAQVTFVRQQPIASDCTHVMQHRQSQVGPTIMQSLFGIEPTGSQMYARSMRPAHGAAGVAHWCVIATTPLLKWPG